jgi:hypothetical protein
MIRLDLVGGLSEVPHAPAERAADSPEPARAKNEHQRDDDQE